HVCHLTVLFPSSSGPPPHPPPFPTRRSSDLDEKLLYVANSDAERKLWMAYPVHEDGTLGKGSVFFDVTAEKANGLPDGMKVDRRDRKSTRLNSSHRTISYAVFCLKKKKKQST